MVMPLPSNQTAIHSFYQREVLLEQPIPREEPRRPGDGFTEAELADALDPLNRLWNPERSYRRYTIDQLVSGPQAVTFEGRIVNLNTRFGRSPKQPKATGWHYFIVKDDTAAISVKLYFAQTPYPLKLGLLVTCWTGFISGIVKPATTPVNNTMSISANMFPGRATADHVLIHHSTSSNSICHTPLDYHPGEQLSGLMTLGSYLSGGHDGVEGAKILVIVKSIGATRTIKRADGGEGELVDVMLMDHTNEIRMTIWDGLIPSARNWVAGETVLLVSSPGYKLPHSGVGKGSVTVLLQTMIDVNPEFRDAEWLKRWAEGKVRNEAFQVGILEDEWDIEAAEYGVVRNFFVLSELDAWYVGLALPYSRFLDAIAQFEMT